MVYLRVSKGPENFYVDIASWVQFNVDYLKDLYDIAQTCDLSVGLLPSGLLIHLNSSDDNINNFCSLSMLQGYHITKEDFDAEQ